MPGHHGVAATPDHLSSLSARASQAVLRYSRRRFEALDLLSLTVKVEHDLTLAARSNLGQDKLTGPPKAGPLQ